MVNLIVFFSAYHAHDGIEELVPFNLSPVHFLGTWVAGGTGSPEIIHYHRAVRGRGTTYLRLMICTSALQLRIWELGTIFTSC